MRPFDRPLSPSIRIVAALVVALTAAAAGPTGIPRPSGSGSPATDPVVPLPCARGSIGPAASGGWWRLTPTLGVAGDLTGQRLVAGSVDGRRYAMALPPESFASGPVAGRVLIGADDGRATRLTILDLSAGCTIAIATEPTVVRRAIVDRFGSAILEFRVDRKTRADLGVWRRPIVVAEPSVAGQLGVPPGATRALEPISPDDRFGITWTTDLAWTDDGRLLVTSCGAIACRTRVLRPATGEALTVADPDLGPTIGFADGSLVSFLACRGRPCPIVATGLIDGHRRTLAGVATRGRLVVGEGGRKTTLVHDGDGRPGRLLAVAVADGSTTEGATHAGERLLGAGGEPVTGVELPAGWLALDRADAASDDPAADGADLGPMGYLRLSDGRRGPALEVLR